MSEPSSTLTERWNRTRYRLYAPVYRWAAKPFDAARQRAIERLDLRADDRILIVGCGTGSDLEYLPADAEVVAVDITPGMVKRTAARAETLGMDVDARVADAQDLPFDDDSFDAVLLHLLLSVVPDPDAVTAETARVLAADGRVSILDKFVPAGERPSLARRLADPFATVLFSSLTRSLEPMLDGTGLEVDEREPFLRGLYTVTVARPTGEG